MVTTVTTKLYLCLFTRVSSVVTILYFGYYMVTTVTT
jgi:hypothetical protein